MGQLTDPWCGCRWEHPASHSPDPHSDARGRWSDICLRSLHGKRFRDVSLLDSLSHDSAAATVEPTAGLGSGNDLYHDRWYVHAHCLRLRVCTNPNATALGSMDRCSLWLSTQSGLEASDQRERNDLLLTARLVASHSAGPLCTSRTRHRHVCRGRPVHNWRRIPDQ